jgi:hypothetical protein
MDIEAEEWRLLAEREAEQMVPAPYKATREQRHGARESRKAAKKRKRKAARERQRKHLSPEYLAYLQSPEWKLFRLTIFAQRGKKCERCGRTNGSIQVHHLHYQNIGHEQPEDVQVLCFRCHGFADALRKRRVG